MIKIGVPFWYGERPFGKFAKSVSEKGIEFIEYDFSYPMSERSNIKDILKIKKKYF